MSGEKIIIGDVVSPWPGCDGIVVCIFDEKIYSSEYPANEWGYIEHGILINSKAGLIHIEEPDEDLSLIRRQNQKTQ